MIYLLLGIIIGHQLREIKFEGIKIITKTKDVFNKEESQFIESVSFKEKWKEAEEVGDLLNK